MTDMSLRPMTAESSHLSSAPCEVVHKATHVCFMSGGAGGQLVKQATSCSASPLFSVSLSLSRGLQSHREPSGTKRESQASTLLTSFPFGSSVIHTSLSVGLVEQFSCFLLRRKDDDNCHSSFAGYPSSSYCPYAFSNIC